MTAMNLVELARLFQAAVTPGEAAQGTAQQILDNVSTAERTRVEQVLAGLLDSPEDERMLRLPMNDTDMVDFEIPQEAGHR